MGPFKVLAAIVCYKLDGACKTSKSVLWDVFLSAHFLVEKGVVNGTGTERNPRVDIGSEVVEVLEVPGSRYRTRWHTEVGDWDKIVVL